MSGYRSLKRVLGESNLERKCRTLFGLCVASLIAIAFLWVDRISEGLIEETAQSKGRDLVRYVLFDLHWQFWTGRDEGQPRQKLVEELNRDIAQDNSEALILSLDEKQRDSTIKLATVYPAYSPEERELLLKLKQEAEAQILGSGVFTPAPASPPKEGPAERERLEAAIKESENASTQPVFKSVRRPQEGLYEYYQVVYWATSCTTCHDALYGKYSQSAASSVGEVFDPASRPFRVVR